MFWGTWILRCLPALPQYSALGRAHLVGSVTGAGYWNYHTCDAGKALIPENYRSYMCATPASPAQNTDIRLSLAVTAGTHFIVR